MLATSGFGPAHVILVVFATLGGSQLTEIFQPNFWSGSETFYNIAFRPRGQFGEESSNRFLLGSTIALREYQSRFPKTHCAKRECWREIALTMGDRITECGRTTARIPRIEPMLCTKMASPNQSWCGAGLLQPSPLTFICRIGNEPSLQESRHVTLSLAGDYS